MQEKEQKGFTVAGISARVKNDESMQIGALWA